MSVGQCLYFLSYEGEHLSNSCRTGRTEKWEMKQIKVMSLLTSYYVICAYFSLFPSNFCAFQCLFRARWCDRWIKYELIIGAMILWFEWNFYFYFCDENMYFSFISGKCECFNVGINLSLSDYVCWSVFYSVWCFDCPLSLGGALLLFFPPSNSLLLGHLVSLSTVRKNEKNIKNPNQPFLRSLLLHTFYSPTFQAFRKGVSIIKINIF